MQLKDAKEHYEASSTSTSTQVEKLSFAGVATVLVLAGGLSSGPIRVSVPLIVALMLFVGALVLAMVQSAYKTGAWYVIFNLRESKLNAQLKAESKSATPEKTKLEREVKDAPDWINTPTWVVFVLKIILCAFGWLAVFAVFAHRLQL